MSLTVENTLPGVTAIVNQGQVARPLERQPSSTLFAIGYASWGQTGVRKVITSYQEFLRVFGPVDPVSYLADTAFIFFNHFGGKQMVVVRAAGSGTVLGSVTRSNRATPAVPTFKFEAKYPSISVNISGEITDTNVTGARNVNLILRSQELGIEEIYNDVDLADTVTRTQINQQSKLVNLTLIAAAVAGANGRPASGAFTLTRGDDDRENLESGNLGNFISRFEDENLGTGQLSIPGFGAENAPAMIAHCERYQRLALIEPPLATVYDEAYPANWAAVSSHSAFYYPWVEMKDVHGGSAKKFYPPTIFAAGACAQVDRTVGTHKAPANIKIPNALDVERNSDGSSVINDNVREYLNARNTNVITPIANEGIKIYGARVSAPAGDTRVRFVHERRMLNLIYYTAKIGYSWAVFSVVDAAGRLFRDLRSSGQTFLRNLWRNGALYGKTEDEAFVVTADDSNNPAEELEAGRVHVQLGVKLSPTAEMIIINIDNVPLSQDLNVLNGGNQ